MEWTPKTCQWIGPEQDPHKGPVEFLCKQPNMLGKSYCAEHYSRVYVTGTSTRRKRQNKRELEAELAKLMSKDEEHEHTL